MIMDLPLFLRRRRRRWFFLFAAAGAAATGYSVYRFYQHPYVNRRRCVISVLRALSSLSSAVVVSADAFALVSSDLAAFLRSDSDDIPRSLKQLAKLAASSEIQNSASKLSESIVVGVSQALCNSGSDPGSFAEMVIDKFFSEQGTGFASVVVGSFARNLVIGFYLKAAAQSPDEVVPKWVRVICADDCRQLIGDCTQRFTTAAVTVFLERTRGFNGYSELFEGLTNPKHEEKMKEILVSVCNGAIETLVKTSHSVISTSRSGSSMNKVNDVGEDDKGEEADNRQDASLLARKVCACGGWVRHVSSTLAVPSNRKFVLDVTGRVTFETVRSFLQFLLSRLYDGASSSVKVVHKEVLERGLDLLRYVSAKSRVIVTMCLTLCMHVLVGTRFLIPA